MTKQAFERRRGAGARTAAHEETCRMFESNFLERFSRIHPATPFIVWIPVTACLLVRSVLLGRLALASVVGLVFLAMFAWTLTEYLLHRYIFHWANDTRVGKRIHFLIHGVHHEYPSDRDRLVMPLLMSVPLGVLFYVGLVSALGRTIGEPLLAGLIVGYLFYDGTHYYVHHFVPTTRWGKFLRRHHMTHHHRDHRGGFGVSSPLWDLILRTMPAKRKQAGNVY